MQCLTTSEDDGDIGFQSNHFINNIHRIYVLL